MRPGPRQERIPQKLTDFRDWNALAQFQASGKRACRSSREEFVDFGFKAVDAVGLGKPIRIGRQ